MDPVQPVRRLIMVGACYIDTILSVSKYPAEDDKLRASELEKRRGGNVANSLEILQHLSSGSSQLDLNLLCTLPNSGSTATQFIKGSFLPNVDLSLCIHREGSSEAASSFIIQSEETSSRTIVNYNDLDEMSFQEFKDRITTFVAKSGNGGMWYHFEGRIPETSVECIRWLKRTYSDVSISVEVEKPAREGLDRMAAEADVVFFSKSWAQARGFEDVESFLREQARTLKSARLLSCTWGGDGAAMISPRDGLYYYGPALQHANKPVVDTVGAGDTFIAGSLSKLLTSEQADIQGTLAFANNLAGRKVLQRGFANLV